MTALEVRNMHTRSGLALRRPGLWVLRPSSSYKINAMRPGFRSGLLLRASQVGCNYSHHTLPRHSITVDTCFDPRVQGNQPDKMVADTSDEEGMLPDNPIDMDEEMMYPQKPAIMERYNELKHPAHHAHTAGPAPTAQHDDKAGGEGPPVPGSHEQPNVAPPEQSSRTGKLAEAEADLTVCVVACFFFLEHRHQNGFKALTVYNTCRKCVNQR
jgi:hypothetical protein